jgi:hypothetical protein
MQLARLRYGLYTRNIPGKLRQIVYALFLEFFLSKQEILEDYLNLAPLGGNIEGFGAASWYYFNKDAGELTTGEIFTLALISQNPGSRAPPQCPAFRRGFAGGTHGGPSGPLRIVDYPAPGGFLPPGGNRNAPLPGKPIPPPRPLPGRIP